MMASTDFHRQRQRIVITREHIIILEKEEKDSRPQPAVVEPSPPSTTTPTITTHPNDNNVDDDSNIRSSSTPLPIATQQSPSTTAAATTTTTTRIPRWNEFMKRHVTSQQSHKNLFRLGETDNWYISVQPNKNHATRPSLRMVVHDKQTQHKLAFVLLTTTGSTRPSMTTTTTTTTSSTSSLMGIFIDPKHRNRGLTRRILSLWLQWCSYANPDMHPQTEIIRKPLLCCVLEHSLGFVVSASSVSSCVAVHLVHDHNNSQNDQPNHPANDNDENDDDKKKEKKGIQLHSIPPQCLRGVFSVRDIQREGLHVHCRCRTCDSTKENDKEQQEQQEQQDESPQRQQQRRRRIHLNARLERLEPWQTVPDDPILQTTLRPDQLRLVLLGHL